MIASPLDILYQDDFIVAINKPSGLLVHKSPIDKRETRFALQEVRNQIGKHVYPVHRLDKPTSGVLLFALSPEIARQISLQFENKTIRKTYLAVVRGHCKGEGLIDHAFKDDPDPLAGIGEDRPLQEALTHYRSLASIELPISVDKYPSSRYSLVECSPITGRKHQIRRHLKHINHPIIGDAKHGKSIHNHFFAEHFNIKRLLLAATALEFQHPTLLQTLSIHAPLAQDFYQLLTKFGWDLILPDAWHLRDTPSCE